MARAWSAKMKKKIVEEVKKMVARFAIALAMVEGKWRELVTGCHYMLLMEGKTFGEWFVVCGTTTWEGWYVVFIL